METILLILANLAAFGCLFASLREGRSIRIQIKKLSNNEHNKDS